jgi:hypothetical protein
MVWFAEKSELSTEINVRRNRDDTDRVLFIMIHVDLVSKEIDSHEEFQKPIEFSERLNASEAVLWIQVLFESEPSSFRENPFASSNYLRRPISGDTVADLIPMWDVLDTVFLKQLLTHDHVRPLCPSRNRQPAGPCCVRPLIIKLQSWF